MSDVEAGPKPAHSEITPADPAWPAVLIVSGIVASILWAAYLFWWVLNALTAMI